MLPSGDFALYNSEYDYMVRARQAGQARLSEKWVRQGRPDPGLAYSAVVAIGNPDRGPGWVLWAGRSDDDFALMPEVRAGRTLAGIGYTTTVLLGLLGIGVTRFSMRRRAALEVEVVRRTAELDAAVHALAASRDNERRFTGDAAHELRTPLAAVKTQAQVARRTPDAGTRDRALEFVIDSVDRTARLVSQLLTLARMDPVDVFSDMESVDLREVSARVLAAVAITQPYKDRDIGLDAVDEVRVTGDDAALEILLRNLVDNALRYSAPAGIVEVRVKRDGTVTTLEVVDTGPGIREAQRERVKDRFFRVPGSSAPGSGLGLSIVQRIVDLHDADMEVFGPPEVEGTVVRIQFRDTAAAEANQAG